MPPPRSDSAPRRHSGRLVLWALLAVLAILVGGVLWGLIYFDDLIPGSNCTDWYVYCPLGPSDFAPGNMGRVPPGSPGCAPSSGEICYAANFETSLRGLTLGHIRFVVANSSAGADTNGPIAPPLPLGPGARVTAIAPSGLVAGVWNVSANEWTSGSGGPVPSGVSPTFVLDTALVSNVTLADAEFDIVLTNPYQGAVGFPLYCGGC